MFDGRIAKMTNYVKDTETTEIEAYMNDGGEKEKFKLVTEVFKKNSPSATLDLPHEGYYDEDIPMLVAIILDLVTDQKNRIPDIHEQLKDICYAFNGMTRTTGKLEDISHSYIVGTDGLLKDNLVRDEE